ncbi:regulatory protein RecX [Rapidithrix thailandica]|uniref:Regulatory protein RecX n=1 Tax=Rapidithrix thailandica TaxID=413964 RepID=A0AAW9S945_9BACT
MRTSKHYSAKEAMAKMAKYCAYQERCPHEVRQKLYTMGLAYSEVDEVMDWLIDEKFLDEERYARAYVRGKFHFKRWGKIKIRHQLRAKQIPEKMIESGFSEINEDAYFNTLKEIIDQKFSSLQGEDSDLKKKQKCFNFAYGRGFEPELIQKYLNNILP